ncbi:sugar phosphate isomerase/epimerase [Paenibacillus doosanensis]|uniref:Inosose dehydratase n=1 Tax=Paenibacillus konkukensis TaxID=2020716 RepID=A0ABY4RVN7_9BACL|nr:MULTISPECIES: sugar phosphate isomerase/epimerase [Paenibacillus]MCS7461191.1 sugar phosphate isomerase/epimerase [Paenibacillus doosanensis]UQZ85424.1 Inosose dehydratase [Paenibacillus konkukensis]
MSLELGLQLYTVRHELMKDPVGALEKVAELGYSNLELAIHYSDAEGVGGYSVYGLRAPELKRCLDRLNMKALNAQMFPIESVNWDYLIPFAQEIGMPAASISMHMFKNKQAVLDFSDQLNRCGETCQKHGLDFYYHNHFQEFQKFDGVYVMDLILQHTDPALVKIEFDTYWALRGGVDPCEYLRVLGNRCDLVHQKDMPASALPVNWFDVFGVDSDITLDKKLGTSSPEQFTEIGSGVMDIAAIIQTVRDMGIVKTIFIEQDFSALNQFDCAKINFAQMTKLLGR